MDRITTTFWMEFLLEVGQGAGWTKANFKSFDKLHMLNGLEFLVCWILEAKMSDHIAHHY